MKDPTGKSSVPGVFAVSLKMEVQLVISRSRISQYLWSGGSVSLPFSLGEGNGNFYRT